MAWARHFFDHTKSSGHIVSILQFSIDLLVFVAPKVAVLQVVDSAWEC
jgi:hypothetical protein